jgi:peptidoglycan/LPS O-acetylase OafA/YrhL
MPFHSTSRNPAYRPDIDGLRAIAVLVVVFYHAALPGFSGGYVGVDIFFVISGFLITGIVWSEIEEKSFSLQNFYVRRIKRIFPALFAVLFFSSIGAFFLLIPQDLAAFGKSVKAALLFSSNFHFLKMANYFDGPAVEKPLLHTWSLSVEEQFYAVWPLVLLLLSRIVPARRVLHVIFGLGLVSLVFAEARLPDYQKDAFYFPWCRGWELLLGAALAVTQASPRPGRLTNALSAAGLAGIALAVFLYDPTTRFPGLTAMLPCAGAALLIWSGSVRTPVSRLLSFEPVRQIGLISYSLYLIHWPLFSFAHLYFNEELTLPLRLAIVAVSVLLAYASWRFVETPFRKASIPRIAVFGTAAAAMSILYLAGVSYSESGGFPSRIGNKVLEVDDYEIHIEKYCREIQIPGIVGGKACEFGEGRGGPYDFILWGDSHAKHFLPAIDRLAEASKLSGVLFWRSACHPFYDDPHVSKDCRAFNAAVLGWSVDHEIKLAILSARWTTHDKFLRRYSAQNDASSNVGGLAKTLAFLNAKGITVSIVEQVPNFPRDVSLCMARASFYNRDSESCVTQPAAALQENRRIVSRYFEFLRKRYIFSQTSIADALCDWQTCRAYQNGKLLIMDTNHLTEAGSLFVAPYLKIPMLSGPGVAGTDPSSKEPSL